MFEHEVFKQLDVYSSFLGMFFFGIFAAKVFKGRLIKMYFLVCILTIIL